MRNKKQKGDSIPIMGKALTEVTAGLKGMQELKGKMDAFLSGYRLASGVPEDWILDTRKMAFVSPPKEKKV